MELRHDITTIAELRKQNFMMKTFPLAGELWNFMSGVAEATLHDIIPRVELWDRNFVKTIPSTA